MADKSKFSIVTTNAVRGIGERLYPVRPFGTFHPGPDNHQLCDAGRLRAEPDATIAAEQLIREL
jgi:hypothetical protein